MKRTKKAGILMVMIASFSIAAAGLPGADAFAAPVNDINNFVAAEQALYSDDYVNITFQSASVNTDEDSFTAVWTFENTTDKNLYTYVRLVQVNGFVLPYYTPFTDINAGQSAEVYMTIPSVLLDMAGITEIGSISCSFYVVDRESYNTVSRTEMLTVQTDHPDAGFAVTTTADDKPFYESDGVSAYFMTYALQPVDTGDPNDQVMQLRMLFYIQNRTESELYFSDDYSPISVNGEVTDDAFFSNINNSVTAGTEGFIINDLYVENIDHLDSADFSMIITYGEIFDTLPSHLVIEGGKASYTIDKVITIEEQLANYESTYGSDSEDTEEASQEEPESTSSGAPAGTATGIPKGVATGIPKGTASAASGESAAAPAESASPDAFEETSAETATESPKGIGMGISSKGSNADTSSETAADTPNGTATGIPKGTATGVPKG